MINRIPNINFRKLQSTTFQKLKNQKNKRNEMLKQPKILKLHHTHRTLKELKTANSKNQIKTRIAGCCASSTECSGHIL